VKLTVSWQRFCQRMPVWATHSRSREKPNEPLTKGCLSWREFSTPRGSGASHHCRLLIADCQLVDAITSIGRLKSRSMAGNRCACMDGYCWRLSSIAIAKLNNRRRRVFILSYTCYEQKLVRVI